MQFNSYSKYYDLLYKDKNYDAEVNYIDALLQKFGATRIQLLEFGSGTGIHGRLLSQKGYEVTGVELSAEMIIGAKETKGFTIQQGDMCSIRLNKTYGAVISLFHVMSYQVSNENIRAAFESASVHLDSGGLFIFDVWYTPAVYAIKPDVRVKQMENDECKVIRVAEPVAHPNENSIDVNFSVHVVNKFDNAYDSLAESHTMRHFSLPELDLLASYAGFERIGAEEFLTGENPSDKTWGVCLIMRKK